MRRHLLAILFAALAVCSTIALVVTVAMGPGAPPEAAQAQTATEAAVVSQPFTDARDVTLDVSASEPVLLTAPWAGRVTRSDCSSGGTVTSGTAPWAIDGRPVIALAMATPPWRDVHVGDEGPDVDALQASLAALDHDVSADGAKVGQATVAAMSAVYKAAGATLPSDAIPLTQTVWLPQATTPIASCDAGLGAHVEAGATLATALPTLTAIRIAAMPADLAAMPADLAAGARELTVGGHTVPVDESGLVADVEGLAGVVPAADDGTPVVGSLALAQPLTASAVPPASIASDDGVTGCVNAEGATRSVTIVGSQLGTTFVIFDGNPPSTVSLKAPPSPCP